jgi:predicted nucleic acid-binding protein
MTDKPRVANDPAPPAAAIEVVLDTNVVLDWLVFDDPAVRAIAGRLCAGTWRWIGTPATLAELADVLARVETPRWRDRAAYALATATERCALDAAGSDAPAPPSLRCADADDQKFIDLAVRRGAPFLFTRDKALLRLARAASAHGVAVLRPAAWSAAVIDDTPASAEPTTAPASHAASATLAATGRTPTEARATAAAR